MLARTAAMLAVPHNIPEGFEFFEHKAVDKDINSPYEIIETLKLTLTRQDEYLLNEKPVKCVTLVSTHGELGIYPSHAYEIVKLVPSPVTVQYPDGTIRRYFVSGGFAHINNEGSCDINCVECIPIEDLEVEIAEKALAQQNSLLAASKDDHAKSVVEIRVGVLEAVIAALRQTSAR